MGLLPSLAGGCQLNCMEVVVTSVMVGFNGAVGAVAGHCLPASLMVQLLLVMMD